MIAHFILDSSGTIISVNLRHPRRLCSISKTVHKCHIIQIATTMHRCFHDGHDIDPAGPVVYIPTHMTPAGTFSMGTVPYCSLPCAKASVSDSVYQLELFTLYHRQVLGIPFVNTAPSPLVLSAYNRHGEGMSIAEYRTADAYTKHRISPGSTTHPGTFVPDAEQEVYTTIFSVQDTRAAVPEGFEVRTTDAELC